MILDHSGSRQVMMKPLAATAMTAPHPKDKTNVLGHRVTQLHCTDAGAVASSGEVRPDDESLGRPGTSVRRRGTTRPGAVSSGETL